MGCRFTSQEQNWDLDSAQVDSKPLSGGRVRDKPSCLLLPPQAGLWKDRALGHLKGGVKGLKMQGGSQLGSTFFRSRDGLGQFEAIFMA